MLRLADADGFQPRWDSYGRLAELLTSVVPTMHIEGNHEVGLFSAVRHTQWICLHELSSSTGAAHLPPAKEYQDPPIKAGQ